MSHVEAVEQHKFGSWNCEWAIDHCPVDIHITQWHCQCVLSQPPPSWYKRAHHHGGPAHWSSHNQGDCLCKYLPLHPSLLLNLHFLADFHFFQWKWAYGYWWPFTNYFYGCHSQWSPPWCCSCKCTTRELCNLGNFMINLQYSHKAALIACTGRVYSWLPSPGSTA